MSARRPSASASTPASEPEASIDDIWQEQALLGGLLFDNRYLERCAGLRAEHFREPLHGRIYTWICARVERGLLANAVALRERAQAEPDFREIGGGAYLVALLDRAASIGGHIESHARDVMDRAGRRALVALAAEMRDLALAPPDGARVEDIVAEVEISLRAIDTGAPQEAWARIGDIARDAVAAARAGKARGISTGLLGVDAHTNGGGPGQLWVLGGATSMGKSIGGQELALNVARQGLGVAYVHLEMEREEVGLRVASRFAWRQDGTGRNRLDGNPHYLDAARGKLTAAQWEAMEAAAASADLPVWVDTTPGLTVAQIEMRVRRAFRDMAREGITPGLLVIDHQGLIASDRRYPSELEQANARARQIKDMAKRLGVWTVVLAQLTKDGASKDGDERLPVNTDVKYGGELMNAAHVVILLHRDAYHAERKPDAIKSEEDFRRARSLKATLIIDKARGGRRGRVEAIMDVASAMLRDRREGDDE